jgi:hypothetical protein
VLHQPFFQSQTVVKIIINQGPIRDLTWTPLQKIATANIDLFAFVRVWLTCKQDSHAFGFVTDISAFFRFIMLGFTYRVG